MKCADWTDFKLVCITRKGLILQYEDLGEQYHILGPDANGITWEITLNKALDSGDPNPDAADFEANFKANCNKPISQVDSDGAVMSRTKVAPSGWNFQFRGVEFQTSTLGSVVNKDAQNADLADATLKLYNAAGVEITNPLFALTAVKTVLDIEPPYDIYIAGGKLKFITQPVTDVRVAVIGVPDVPAQLGGSKAFVQNVNLKFIPAADGVNADGRAAKWLQYSATYHTNKIRFIVYHDVTVAIPIAVFLELYRQ